MVSGLVVYALGDESSDILGYCVAFILSVTTLLGRVVRDDCVLYVYFSG